MLKNSIYIMNHFDKRFDKYRNMKNNDWHRYSQFSLPYSYIKKGWKTIDFFLQIFKKPLTFANLKDITSKMRSNKFGKSINMLGDSFQEGSSKQPSRKNSSAKGSPRPKDKIP